LAAAVWVISRSTISRFSWTNESGFELVLLGIWQAEISENVT
jgi:hypothetical protein